MIKFILWAIFTKTVSQVVIIRKIVAIIIIVIIIIIIITIIIVITEKDGDKINSAVM